MNKIKNLLFSVLIITTQLLQASQQNNMQRVTTVQLMTSEQTRQAILYAEERESERLLERFQQTRERAQRSIQIGIDNLQEYLAHEQNDDLKKPLIEQLDQLKTELSNMQSHNNRNN